MPLFKFEVIETVSQPVVYEVEAETLEEAITKAAAGETEDETLVEDRDEVLQRSVMWLQSIDGDKPSASEITRFHKSGERHG